MPYSNFLEVTNLLLVPNSLQVTNSLEVTNEVLFVTTLPAPPTPTFSPVAGSYGSVQNVAITSAGADTIYYTTNGVDPTTGDTVYSGPISVGTSETLKALAVQAGHFNSAIGSAAYVINLAVVQSAAGDMVSGVTSATFASPVTPGNAVVVFVKTANGFGATTCTGVSDTNGGNVYTLVRGPDVSADGSNSNNYIFICNSNAGSPTVVTAATAGAAFTCAIVVVEVSGYLSVDTSTFDAVSGATYTGAGIVTAGANELLLCVAANSNSQTMTQGTGWTDVAHGALNTSLQSFYYELEKRVATTAGTYTPIANNTGGTNAGSMETIALIG